MHARGAKSASRFRVAVIGGGLGGLTAALALRANGVEAVVFEAAHELRELGAGVMIGPNGMRCLEEIGVAEAVSRITSPLTQVDTYTWQGAEVQSRMFMSEKPGDRTFYPAHRAELQRTLCNQLPPGTIHLGHRLTRLVEDDCGVNLQFADGKRSRFDVVIGADGIHSVVQGFVANPVHPSSEGIMAYRGLIPIERLTGMLDVSPNRGAMWMGNGRSFLIFPVSRGRLLNVAAFVPTDLDGDESWSASGDVTTLAAEYDGWAQPVQDVIAAMDETFRWGIYDRHQPERWSTERIALLGDAAHATTPHLGQGLNQSIEDAATLGVLLADVDLTDVPGRFRLYEELRRERTNRIQQGSRKMGRTYRAAELSIHEREEAMASVYGEGWIFDHDAVAVARKSLQTNA